jgi:hypothetical protein
LSPYYDKPPIPYTILRILIPVAAVGIFLALWFGLIILFLEEPIIVLCCTAAVVLAFLAVKIRKNWRLSRDLKRLEKDPVNPANHFHAARDYFYRGVLYRNRQNLHESLRSFRNAVQLDLELDIKKPAAVAAAMIRKYGSKSSTIKFVRLMSLYATIDFLFEEYERLGLSSEDLFLGRTKFLQFDPRLIANMISAYEMRLKELEMYRFQTTNDPYISAAIDMFGPQDVFAARKRQVDLLISFHQEMLTHMRRLYREYQHL